LSKSSDPLDIPVLTDVVVAGHASHAKSKRGKRGAASHHLHEDAPVLHDVIEPTFRSAPETDLGPVPEPLPEPLPDPVVEPIYRAAHEPALFMPGEAEFTSGSIAERYVPPPDPNAPPVVSRPVSVPGTREYDADVLAERLRGRFATYLTGEGRDLIEARCRDAFQDHTTWLVNQITREVALALETEMLSWVREAIREEMRNRPNEE
jgi:hypothetical protein